MRWRFVAAAFAAGLAASVLGFRLAGPAIRCQMSERPQTGCPTHPFGQELVYAGLVMLAVALLSALVLLARTDDERRGAR